MTNPKREGSWISWVKGDAVIGSPFILDRKASRFQSSDISEDVYYHWPVEDSNSLTSITSTTS